MNRLIKGYENDAGVDVILDEDVTVNAYETKAINLHINVTPKPGQFAMLIARTSAAKRGLYVAMCPIDADYIGDVWAIVTNLTTEPITYKAGEAFCQVVGVQMADMGNHVDVKKVGRRTTSNFGGTDRGPNTSKNS